MYAIVRARILLFSFDATARLLPPSKQTHLSKPVPGTPAFSLTSAQGTSCSAYCVHASKSLKEICYRVTVGIAVTFFASLKHDFVQSFWTYMQG